MNIPTGRRHHRPEEPARYCADDLTRDNVESMRRVEHAALERRSRADRMAAFIAGFCGSMYFVWLHVAVFAFWLGFNTLPGLQHFDPFPFTFLTLVVSLEAIFLSSFILHPSSFILHPDQPELRTANQRPAQPA